VKVTEIRVWDTVQVAEFLNRSPAAVRNLVLRRVIPYRKVAGRLTFLRREIVQWIESSPGVALQDLKQNCGPIPRLKSLDKL